MRYEEVATVAVMGVKGHCESSSGQIALEEMAKFTTEVKESPAWPCGLWYLELKQQASPRVRVGAASEAQKGKNLGGQPIDDQSHEELPVVGSSACRGYALDAMMPPAAVGGALIGLHLCSEQPNITATQPLSQQLNTSLLHHCTIFRL